MSKSPSDSQPSTSNATNSYQNLLTCCINLKKEIDKLDSEIFHSDSMTDEEKKEKEKKRNRKFKDLDFLRKELTEMEKKLKELKQQQKEGKIDKDGFQKPEPPK